jgi:hypothetical protein
MRSLRREATGHRDRGAVAVETAVISSLLIVLLYGIIETSLLFRDWISVSAAARAGARMGASQPLSPTFGQDSANQVTNALATLTPANIQEVWVYKASGTTGMPDSGSFASCSTCLKYTWDSSTSKLKFSSGSWSAASQNACAGDPDRDSLGVYLKYKHTSPIGFFFNGAIMSESTVMWLEPTTAVACKP